MTKKPQEPRYKLRNDGQTLLDGLQKSLSHKTGIEIPSGTTIEYALLNALLITTPPPKAVATPPQMPTDIEDIEDDLPVVDPYPAPSWDLSDPSEPDDPTIEQPEPPEDDQADLFAGLTLDDG